MIYQLAKVESSVTGRGLFNDYVTNIAEGVPPFIGGIGSLFDGGIPPLRESPSPAAWDAVVDEVTALSKRLGADEAIIEKLGHARSRRARFVVTGQQPGVLGGPLYTIYKLATAIAVAARVEARYRLPCIPLYWCGADDTDFQEIRDFVLITNGLSTVSAAIATEGYAVGMPVGDIDKRWIAEVWQNTARFVDEHVGGARVHRSIDAALSISEDHGELAAAVLLRLLAGRCAVVDGRSPIVRRFAQRLLGDYVADEAAIKDDVTDAGRRLEEAGYHAQLSVGADSGVFIIEAGRRHSVSPQHRDALLETVKNRVEQCSPGVIARNLVQDYTFEPVAVVLGPAEIAYRAQIGQAYDRLGVERPAEFPRMAATFVPPPLDALVAEVGDAARLVGDPARYVGGAYSALMPAAITESALTFENDVREALERLTQRIDDEMTDKAGGKLRGRVKEFDGRAAQLASAVRDVGKARVLERWPYLAGLAQLIRPGEKPQERRVSSMVPSLFSAADPAGGLVDLASAYVDELVDGRFRHSVYSVQP